MSGVELCVLTDRLDLCTSPAEPSLTANGDAICIALRSVAVADNTRLDACTAHDW